MRDRGLRIPELAGGVRVAVEREQTPGGDGTLREVVVDVLPRRIAIDLDRHIGLRRRPEHLLPAGIFSGVPSGWSRDSIGCSRQRASSTNIVFCV